MSKTVVGIFETQDHAEVAARRIKEQGLRTDDISIVAKQGDSGDPYDAGAAADRAGAGGADGNAGFGIGPVTMGGGPVQIHGWVAALLRMTIFRMVLYQEVCWAVLQDC